MQNFGEGGEPYLGRPRNHGFIEKQSATLITKYKSEVCISPELSISSMYL